MYKSLMGASMLCLAFYTTAVAQDQSINMSHQSSGITDQSGKPTSLPSRQLDKRSGYEGYLQASYYFGIGVQDINRIHFDIVNGYKFNQSIFLGIGTGFRYFDGGNQSLVPIYASFRANLNRKMVSPYLMLNAGYSFNVTDDFVGDGGMMLTPSVGLNVLVGEKSRIHVGIGPDFQGATFYGNNSQTKDYSFGIGLNLGVTF